MARAENVVRQDGSHYGWRIDCPGCNAPHVLDTRWTFTGTLERPTFRASLLVHEQLAVEGVKYVDGIKPGDVIIPRCHSFITDGRIQFLDDCTHALKGQTVDLPEIEP
jgi:hypothetical protein